MSLLTKLIISCGFLVSCASTAPYREYAFAHKALKAAQEIGAQKLNKANYIQANSYFIKARIAFQKKNYGQAKTLFKKAQFYAEQSELFSYLKKNQNPEEVLY